MTPRSIRDFRIASSSLAAGSVGPAPLWHLNAVLRDEEDARSRYRCYQAAGRQLSREEKASLGRGLSLRRHVREYGLRACRISSLLGGG
jgi:hypothetical protein